MKWAAGHSWEVRLEPEVWAQAPVAVDLSPESLEMAGAKESACFSPCEKTAPQKPSWVESTREKGWDEMRWDVLGAAAGAQGHSAEGAAATPPQSAAAGKVDSVGGTQSYTVN